MKDWLKKYFIPNKNNGCQPYILRKKAVFYVLGIVLLFELLFILATTIIVIRTDFLAAILPDVVVDLTNEGRRGQGLLQLKTSDLLTQAAQQKAEDMAKLGYFSHLSPQGKTPWYWFEKAGYAYNSAGENLAIHFFDSKEVVDAWMDSAPHRLNILNERFTETGVGVARGYYDGNETIFIVQLFGQPRMAEPQKEVSKVDSSAPGKTVQLKETAINDTESINPNAAVENSDLADSDPLEEEQEKAEKNEILQVLSQSSSWPEKVVSSPRTSSNYFYFAVIAFFLLVFFVNVLVEVKNQHGNVVFNGLFILFFVSSVILINRYLMFYEPQIFGLNLF